MKYLLIICLALAMYQPAHAIHFFNGTYEQALAKARSENKNLFINFTASWCGPCRLMKKIVFENEKVTAYTDKHYICLQLDIEFPEHLHLQQRVNPGQAGAIPHCCILSPDEKILKEAGSMTVSQTMKFLAIKANDLPGRDLLPSEKTTALETPRLFQFRTPYQAVREQAARENKNMLLCFSSHFCGPCRQMEETSFRNPAIMEKVNATYITGYFETGDLKDKALYLRYFKNPVTIPSFIIATPDEKILRKKSGYLDSTAFMNFIQTPGTQPIDSILPQPIQLTEGTPSLMDKFFYNQRLRKWELRMKAALHINTLKTGGSLADVNFNYRTGYEIGIYLEHARKHFALIPGLSFISMGGKNKATALRQNYLMLPVQFTWMYSNHFNGHWKGISIAPYGAMRIGGKLKSDASLPSQSLSSTQRFDYGLRFATNLHYSSFDFEAGYTLGLHNLSKHPGGKIYNRGFFIGLSLCFGG